MRIESSTTAISWIPSEAIEGITKLPFEAGLFHYDAPPPDQLDESALDRLHKEDAFREANHLRAWIDVTDGKITGYDHAGRSLIGVTRLKAGPFHAAFPAISMPVLRPEPVVKPTSVRFVQTGGGRMSLPAPRRVRDKPFVQIASSLAWTTLALTIHTDGHSEYEVVGASPFPRHWLYDQNGKLVSKSGVISFEDWYRGSYGKHTPWGEEESPALMTEVESSLERELSRTIMRGGAKPRIQTLTEGSTLVEQGQPGTDLFVLLDGMLDVEVNGSVVAEVGPGAVLGERSNLEAGHRTATLRAKTKCRVAVADPDQVSEAALAELAAGRRREP